MGKIENKPQTAQKSLLSVSLSHFFGDRFLPNVVIQNSWENCFNTQPLTFVLLTSC